MSTSAECAQGPAMAANDFSFVAWEPNARQSRATMFQIKSHSMRGKNVRHDSRRSLRRARQAAKQADQQPPDADSVALPNELDVAPTSTVVKPRTGKAAASTSAKAAKIFSESIHPLPLLIQIAPEMLQLAVNAQTSPRQFLQQLIAFTHLTKAVYLANSVVDFVPDQDPAAVLPLNDGLVQTIMFVNAGFRDLCQGQPLTKATRVHLAQSLHLLNHSLAEKDAHLQDAILYIIVNLIFAACAVGDSVALKYHIAGLNKIVRLRGLEKLSPYILFKLTRIDLAWLLKFGGTPFFQDVSKLYEANWIKTLPTPSDEDTSRTMSLVLERIDPGLRVLVQHMRGLTALANHVAEARRGIKVGLEEFHQANCFIQAGLFDMLQRATEGLDNWVCLGMLAFALSIVKIPSYERTHAYFAGRLREAVADMRSGEVDMPTGMIAWVLVISGVSAVEPSEAWMRQAWAEFVGLETQWPEMREQLREVLWIDIVHDRVGQATFRALRG